MKYVNIGDRTLLILRKHHTEELFNHIWACRWVSKEKHISEENIGFGLWIWIKLYFTGFGLEILCTAVYNITLITYFTGFRFENTLTSNLDYNYYILRNLDFKIFRLWIWISIVVYLTGLGLENTWTTNLDYDVNGFGLWNTWTVVWDYN